MAFVSLYFHNLDSKNRLFVPVRFRDDLGENFYVMPGEGSCLFLYPKDTFEEIAEQYRRTHRDIKQQTKFFSAVSVATVDNQGRVTLEGRHVSHAGLVKEVAVVGGGRRVEIWPMEKFKIVNDEDDNAIDFSEDIDW